ncbi:PAP2 family protein [Clavispora lusitaniae]|uniref:PAP2 family protein n=1 Tax=Clavispora lusitaniae TaxID=36911 RepID=UPI00202C9AF2|nr:PAP2 family protein [Clavispora lusitaniae]
MSLAAYVRSPRCRRHVPDWIAAILITVFFLGVAEHIVPFHRQFKLSDPTIQHPFALVERVSGPECLVLAAFIPPIVMALVTFIKHRNRPDHAWHVWTVSVLGVFLAVSTVGTATDILKAWIGRPRPDFLVRCGPRQGTPFDEYVTAEVCTAPFGMMVLEDGMRSTPSGHSAISFAAFGFLSAWLAAQFGVAATERPIHWHFAALLPLVLAFYVALSRTQDYRHHFVDIILGAFLGIGAATTCYRKYFPAISEGADPLDSADQEPQLPL